MINLVKGHENKVILRLSSNIDIPDPYFLFNLKSIQSGLEYNFMPEDVSNYSRFNEFNIIEITGTSQSISLTSSTPKIYLDYTGSYLYTIYQMATQSLIPNGKILEQGKATVFGDVDIDIYFEVDDEYSLFDEIDEESFFETNDNMTYSIFK